MMRIVIYDDNTIRFTAYFEPASGSGKLSQCPGCICERQIEQLGHGQRCQRITDVVFSRDLEFNFGSAFPSTEALNVKPPFSLGTSALA